MYYSIVIFIIPAGQRVIGEPVASGLALDDSKTWDPDFKIAAQCVTYNLPYIMQHFDTY